MTNPPLPLLLLSGAGLPGWAWDPVLTRLPADQVVAIARYPRRDDGDVSVEEYGRDVLSQVTWPRFVIAAHSIGGVVATEVVRQAPERVAGVLAISAAIPAEGDSFLQSLPLKQRVVFEALVRLKGPTLPKSEIRNGLASGLDDALTERIVTDLESESRGLYLDESGPRTWPERRGYLFTTEDKEISPEVQRGYADTLGAGWTRSLATGHLPMLENADGVAAAIDAFVRGDAVTDPTDPGATS